MVVSDQDSGPRTLGSRARRPPLLIRAHIIHFWGTTLDALKSLPGGTGAERRLIGGPESSSVDAGFSERLNTTLSGIAKIRHWEDVQDRNGRTVPLWSKTPVPHLRHRYSQGDTSFIVSSSTHSPQCRLRVAPTAKTTKANHPPTSPYSRFESYGNANRHSRAMAGRGSDRTPPPRQPHPLTD